MANELFASEAALICAEQVAFKGFQISRFDDLSQRRSLTTCGRKSFCFVRKIYQSSQNSPEDRMNRGGE